jgi:hypothetical protein
MNHDRPSRPFGYALLTATIGIVAVCSPTKAEEIVPFEAKTGNGAIPRLEIADGPDPVDTIDALYVKVPIVEPTIPTTEDTSSTRTTAPRDATSGAFVGLRPPASPAYLATIWLSAPDWAWSLPVASLPDGTIVFSGLSTE